MIHNLKTLPVRNLFRNEALDSFQGTLNQPKESSIRQIVGDKGMIVMPNAKSLTSDRVDEVRVELFEDKLFSVAGDSNDYRYQLKTTWKRYPIPGELPPGESLSLPQRIFRKLGMGETISKTKPIKPPNNFCVLMNGFIDAVLHDGAPLVDGESARLTLKVINGMILSAVRKKVVDFPIDPEEYDILFQELWDVRTKILHFRPSFKYPISVTD